MEDARKGRQATCKRVHSRGAAELQWCSVPDLAYTDISNTIDDDKSDPNIWHCHHSVSYQASAHVSDFALVLSILIRRSAEPMTAVLACLKYAQTWNGPKL